MPSSNVRLTAISVLVAWAIGCGRATPSSPAATAGARVPPTQANDTSPDQKPAPADSVWLIADPPDLRGVTVVVHVVPPPDIAAAYADLGARHRDLRPLMEAHNEGGFGSGFVVVARGQTGPVPYVLTNQHVVGLATEVALSKEGSTARVPAAVVYVDPVYDLAILRPATEGLDTWAIEAGLGFAAKSPHDQDAVVATGFPGIQGAPSYQVTRGHVSNERVLIDVDGEQLSHIQHTAPIDPGSSGGPLLSVDGQVLGINTLKLRWREGVGLAVPAAIIEQALDRVRVGGSVVTDPSAARALCERLLHEAPGHDGSDHMERLLGAELVAKEGARSLWLLPEGDTDWPARFVEDPARVMATAIGFRLGRELDGQQIGPCNPGATTTDSKRTFTVQVGSVEKSATFGPEQGSLKLLDFSFSPKTGRSFLAPKRSSGKKWKPSL